MLEGLVSSEASLLALQIYGYILLVFSHHLPSTCVCISSYPLTKASKRENPIGLEPTLMTSFQLNYFFKYSISKNVYTRRSWGLGQTYVNFRVEQGNTSQPITTAFNLQKQNCLECLILFLLPYPTSSWCLLEGANLMRGIKEKILWALYLE